MSIVCNFAKLSQSDFDSIIKNHNNFEVDSFNFDFDIDKSWEVIHFLITGTVENTSDNSPIWSQDGFEFGEDEDWLNCLSSDKVKIIAKELESMDDNWFKANFVNEDLEGKNLYGYGYNTFEEECEYYQFHLQELTEYFAVAADQNLAIVNYIA
jgi:Domain of unknown function (DUF1877)